MLVPDGLDDGFEAAEEEDLVMGAGRADPVGEWNFVREEIDEEEVCGLKEVDRRKPVTVCEDVSLELHVFGASIGYSWASIAEIDGIGRIHHKAGYFGAVLFEKFTQQNDARDEGIDALCKYGFVTFGSSL